MASLGTSVPDTSLAASTAAGVPAAPDLYQTALSDYMAAKYTLASSEFSDVIRNYPGDALAGNAFYYQGEIDYRAGKFSAAIKDYDHVLEDFPDNPKVAVSHLHKGMAFFELKQNEAGIRELRALIARFPASPEASAARSKLNGMGVAIVPRH
jgi:tol-pal system protein YbgF